MSKAICTACATEAQKISDWKKYELLQCPSCQLIFSDPIPNNAALNDFYQGFLHRLPNDEQIGKIIQTKKKELIRLFGRKKNIKFLDYGGGTGLAFQAAKELGWEAYYFDIDKESIDFVRKKFAPKEEQFITDIDATKHRFDCIMADNVIEHVPNPQSLIEQLYSKLANGGQLVFKTPNAQNTETYFYPRVSIVYLKNLIKYNPFGTAISAFFKRTWHCDPPRHIYSFSAKSFSCIMKNMGIAEGEVELLYYRLPLWEFSITRSFLYLDRPFTGLKSLLIRLLVFPLVILEVLLKIIHWTLAKTGLISPPGLILRICRAI